MGQKKVTEPTAAQDRATKLKNDELTLLRSQEEQRVRASGRRKRGRSSLISGNATGIMGEA